MSKRLHIPPFVNYDCQVCGWCCGQYDITFSEDEHARLSKHDWGKLEPALAGRAWCGPLRDRDNPDAYRLRYKEGGACVFLSSDNRCLMHAHVGELGKTLGCCVYPFTFAATPSGVYVGMRFSCKAAAYGLGAPAVRRRGVLEKQASLCEKAGQLQGHGDEVRFDGRRVLPWGDYLRLEEALIRIFLRDDVTLARRLFFAFKLVDLLQGARLENVRGAKFGELIGILEAGLFQEAATEPLPGGPRGIQRVLFRQFCAIFQRRYGGAYRELSGTGKLRERLRYFWTGVQFVAGRGSARLKAFPGGVPLGRIRSVEVPGPVEEPALSRFLAAKVFGKQYFGRLFFDYSVVDGFTFLLLSAGAVMWYARAHALARGSDKVAAEDVIEAIRYVDFCYGPSRAAGTRIERARVGMLGHGDGALRLALGQFGE